MADRKPPFIRGVFDMSHVPEPDPANFWELILNEPRVVMVKTVGVDIEPMLTITVRKVDGDRVSLQITAAPEMANFQKQ